MTITYAPGQSPDDARKALEAMAARAKNLRPVLEVQALAIKKLIDDSFRQSRSPDGTPWLPNAASTVARKGSAKPGINTSVLRDSVDAVASGNDIRFGTNVPYAAPNQYGGTRTGNLKRKSGARAKGTAFRVTQPARPFMPFTIAGTLITIGPASNVFRRLARAVGVYVTTGEITG